MRAILFASLLTTACSGSESSNELQFAGETAVLPDFAYDTGMQPSSGPVQIKFEASAGGSLKASAQAIAGGTGASAAVAAVPGSGTYTLDAHFKLGGMLHVDVSGMRYDGPIPGIENVDIAFGGETVFDPFLMAGTAKVTAMLPETKLPDIPLPGGLPGHLELTIGAGSTMTSVLAGRCASFEGNSAKFLATTSTSAKIMLQSKIVLQVPVVGDKDFGLPTIEIPVPAFSAPLDLGSQTFEGGGEPPTGVLAEAGACGANDPNDPNNPNNPGGAVCAPVDADYDHGWHPPNGLRAGACNAAQLSALNSQCLAAGATKATCSAFQTKPENVGCMACVVTPATSPGYGPIVMYDTYTTYNLSGCLAAEAPGELQCAKNTQKYDACLERSCSGCKDSTTADRNACLTKAQTTTCAVETMDARNCLDRITLNRSPGYVCYEDYDYAARFCGP
jgi:hypothetical protein